MSYTTAADIAPALSLLYARPRTSQINFASTLLHTLAVMPSSGGRTGPTFTAEFTGQSNAVAAADGARRAYTDAGAEIEVPGTIPWAIYDKVASITGLARATAAGVGRAFDAQSLIGAGVNSIAQARVQRSFNRIVKGIAGDIYAGSATSPQSITGIASAIDSAGTYGTIAPGTYSEWASVGGSIAAADLSFQTVNTTLLTPIYKACGEKPSFLITDPDTFDKYRALYGNNAPPYLERIRLPGAMMQDRVAPDRVVSLIDAGVDAFAINGIPLLRDVDCTVNTTYAINTRYLYLEQQVEVPEVFLDPAGMQDYFRRVTGNAALVLPPQVAAELLGFMQNPQGIVPGFKMLGATGDSDEILVKAYVQLVCSRRNAMGKINHT